ncbi:ABC transporter ATP-binding protein [Alphaproteobacteria bacterium]|nr:ABC transporter ATP-binding protein [Alphaproteobacteria bacterium]
MNSVEKKEMLVTRNLNLSFGGINALKDLSFSVVQGSITSLIGPNGAGKTSVFNIISGFHKPDSGSINFLGEEILNVKTHSRPLRGLARTFQNISLFQGMTVLENLKLGAHSIMRSGIIGSGLFMKHVREEEEKIRFFIEKEIIDFLEIDSIRYMPVSILPYGLQKRVELGRALAMKPKLILLDEPVAGMNREETEDIARFILDIKEEKKITILLVEHDMHMVMDISDKIVVLNFGKNIASGLPKEISNNQDVIEAYLGKRE